ncbi:MAG: type II toxin-antitoxin system RelE/ParE family toxin [Saprospiraceae bacterium]|nr:type II toxin-antitoxin system RelE/ParE family toxin [Saprospiraceae bacterium]
MRKLRLSPAASEDFENILQFTMETWGVNQFEQYLAGFQHVFDIICIDPSSALSKERGELFDDCRSIRSGRHIVFFRLKNDNVEVVRILHDKMDFLSQFPMG